MNTIKRHLLSVAFVAVLLTTAGVGLAQAQIFGPTFGTRFPDRSGNGFAGRNVLVVIGLTSDQRLICFRADQPQNAGTIAPVSGLVGGETRLIGIDFRAANNSLYGVGNLGNVYIINQQTGAATRVNSLTIPLVGTSFGVDFNPAADRLRIISDTGQNLRHDVRPGGTTINDGTLNYAMIPATGVTGAAYTNNDNTPVTGTTLYDIDSNLDQLVTQDPANSGNLNLIGSLGVNTSPSVGFDIYTDVDRFNVSFANRGFASLTRANNPGITGFFFVNLQTGDVTQLGQFSSQNVVVDVALPLNQLSPFLL